MTPLLVQAATLSPDSWAIAGRVSVMVAVGSSALLLFFWRAMLRALWCAGLSLSASDLRAHTCEAWKVEIAERESVARQVRENVDKIEYLEASILAQGKALQGSLAEAIRAQTLAMEGIARSSEQSFRSIQHSLEVLTEDTNANARAIAGLEGFLRNPESSYSPPPERRKSGRRKPEGN